MYLNTGTPKNINFLFETNGKLMALGVPILKHFRVFLVFLYILTPIISNYWYLKVNFLGPENLH